MYFHKDDDAIMWKLNTIIMSRGGTFSSDGINQCINSYNGIFFIDLFKRLMSLGMMGDD